MTQKTRTISLIICLAFLVSILISSGVYFLSTYLNKVNQSVASTEENYIISQNLFNKNGTINYEAAYDLLNAIGYYNYTATTTPYKAHQILTRNNAADYNGDSSIIFPMGYLNGVGDTELYWQATYLYNNYLTIWLVRGYVNMDWNEDSSTVTYDSYANSTIQNYIDDTLFPLITLNSSDLQSVFVTPYVAGYQTLSNGTTNDTGYLIDNDDVVFYTGFDNMSIQVGFTSYMWLPSFGEIINNTNEMWTSNTTNYIGLWGLNSTDRAFNATNYDGTTSSYAWLRSGRSRSLTGSFGADGVSTSGGRSGYSGVFGNCSVRPAMHLSLDALAEYAKYQINVQSGNAEYGTVSEGVGVTPNESITISATPSASCLFDHWENSLGSVVSYDQNYSFIVTQPDTYTAIFRKVVNFSTDNGANYTLSADNNALYSEYLINFTNYFVYGFSINTYSFILEYQTGYITTINACTAIEYVLNNDASQLYLKIIGLNNDLNIIFNLNSSSPTLQPATSGGGVNTVAVVSTYGGSAEIVGDNFTDDSQITLVARNKINGYQFVGWFVGDSSTPISTEMSVRLDYADIQGEVITARFEPIDNSTQNSATDNGYTTDFI